MVMEEEGEELVLKGVDLKFRELEFGLGRVLGLIRRLKDGQRRSLECKSEFRDVTLGISCFNGEA